MPRDTRTTAEKLRAHREAFELALQLRCTPAQAAEELHRRAAAARHDAGTRRLAAKINTPLRCSLAEPDEPRPPWWQRDS